MPQPPAAPRRRWARDKVSASTHEQPVAPQLLTPQPVAPRLPQQQAAAPHVSAPPQAPGRREPQPPPGLNLATLDAELAAAALAEIRPCFPVSKSRGKGTSSTMFEMGLSFLEADQQKSLKPAKPLHSFPKTQALLSRAMAELHENSRASSDTGDIDLQEERLNVICRLYYPGQGIPMHVDRKEMFAEDVYGCVLENTSDEALVFRKTDRLTGNVTEEYRVEERPGTCFKQRGEARYRWSHGVEPLHLGQRVSMTWRWFDPDYAEKQTVGPEAETAEAKATETRPLPRKGQGRGRQGRGRTGD